MFLLIVIAVMLIVLGFIFIQQNPLDNSVDEVVNNTTITSEKISQDDGVDVSTSQEESLPYDINNLPPSNDSYPETARYQIDLYHVRQEYEDDYHSIVDLRTGERSGGFGN